MNEDILPDSAPLYRRPADVIFLAVGVFILVVGALVLLATRNFFEPLVNFLASAIQGASQTRPALLTTFLKTGPLAAVVVAVALALVLRRMVLARNLLVGGILAWLVTTILRILILAFPGDIVEEFLSGAPRVAGSGIPAGSVAIVTALAMMADAFLSKRLRLVTWALALLVAVTEFLVRSYSPIEIVNGAALGLVVGALANLLLGVPRQDVRPEYIRRAFKDHGIFLKTITPVSADARGSVPYFATSAEGDKYFMKMLGSQQRDADFLFKLWRSALLRNPPSSAPFLTPMQQIEHEAYLTLLAQKHGVRTPDVEFTARLENGFSLLAQKQVAGRTIADLRDEESSDELLGDIWQEVGRLHEARLYHGDLRRSNILVDANKKPWLIDFGFAAAGADDEVLGQDTAQLLASMAPIIGAERAVIPALKALGPDALADAMPALQPLALSSETREDLKRDPTFLDELKEELEQVIPAEKKKEEESVFRIQRKTLLFVFGLGLGIYLLLPQLGELDKVLGIWSAVNPYWLALALFGSFLTYVIAAIAQQGAVEKPLPFWQNVSVHFAGTFASRLSPGGLGAGYVLERFMEKFGVNSRQALAALALNGAAGAGMHVLLVFMALALVGISGPPPIKNIAPWQFAVALALLLVVIMFLIRYPDKVRESFKAFKASLKDLSATLRHPTRALELFGGSVAITLAYIMTLVVSLWALGINIAPLEAAAVYLLGTMIGTASPAPGGLGVVESAFVVGLKTFGVDESEAIAGVLLYRLITYWLPILPGLFAFRYFQKRNYF